MPRGVVRSFPREVSYSVEDPAERRVDEARIVVSLERDADRGVVERAIEAERVAGARPHELATVVVGAREHELRRCPFGAASDARAAVEPHARTEPAHHEALPACRLVAGGEIDADERRDLP